MRPITARSMVGAALGISALLGLPLLHPRSGEPVPPTGSETSIVDTATTDTLVDTSTTLVDSSSVPPSSSDTTAVDSSSSAPDTPVDTTAPPPPIVVAAAGDMSCPLADPVTPTKCHAAAVSDAMLREPEPRAALRPRRPAVRRRQPPGLLLVLRADLRPSQGHHPPGGRQPRVHDQGRGGLLHVLRRRGRHRRRGLVQLRPGIDLARRRPQLQLRPGRLRRRQPPGAVAPGRPRRLDPPVHDRVLAPPAVLLGRPSRERPPHRCPSGRRSSTTAPS